MAALPHCLQITLCLYDRGNMIILLVQLPDLLLMPYLLSYYCVLGSFTQTGLEINVEEIIHEQEKFLALPVRNTDLCWL
jgi:hypothetical protein